MSEVILFLKKKNGFGEFVSFKMGGSALIRFDNRKFALVNDILFKTDFF